MDYGIVTYVPWLIKITNISEDKNEDVPDSLLNVANEAADSRIILSSGREEPGVSEKYQRSRCLFHTGAKNSAQRNFSGDSRVIKKTSVRVSTIISPCNPSALVISTSLVSLRQFKGSLAEREEPPMWNRLIQALP